MLRRQQRIRREYLYRKSLEAQRESAAKDREQVRGAIEDGKSIAGHLAYQSIPLSKVSELDDEGQELITSHEDDEYRYAGVQDPKVVITTSVDPSSRLKMFAKEMKLIFPNSQRINRGAHNIKELITACRANDVTDFILIHETRGQPDNLIISHLPYGPTAFFTICNAVMRHDIPNMGTMSEAYPHLVFHGFTTKLGKRVTDVLKYLYPVPKPDSKRVISFVNNEDYISFRHHNYKKVDGEIIMEEVGPRFELKLYKIILGTLDLENTADVEWVLRPYMNTTKKRTFL